MKKFGKYEKQPKTKSVLLQTYFTSLLSLVLCVTMFFGTSYAWFTSEVQNTGNEIYIGTLDVDLQKKVDVDTWVSLSALENGANKDKLFDSNIRWEPGYTALETLRIVNEGDLAFRYVLNFTDGTIADGSDLNAVAGNFDVWVYNHRVNENKDGAVSAPASYAEITVENGWEPVGTLAEVLSGKAVLGGDMAAVRDSKDETPVNAGTTDGVATADTYTISLHMKEEANDVALMGKIINLNVKLVAYQMASESETDGFGNQNYDSNVTAVSDVKSLQSALSNGGNVQLITDVEIGKAEDRMTMNGGVLYGNGKEIAYTGDRVNGGSVGVVTTSGGTVKNLTINGGENGRALFITKLDSDLYVSDCTFSGAYAFNLNSAAATEYTVNFTNTVFKSWSSYANVMAHAYFTGCTFEDVLRPYGDTTLTNCTFITESQDEGLDVSALAADETITLANCTYNDTVIEKAVLTAKTDENGMLTVECDNALLTISEGLVVLNGTNG